MLMPHALRIHQNHINTLVENLCSCHAKDISQSVEVVIKSVTRSRLLGLDFSNLSCCDLGSITMSCSFSTLYILPCR